MKKLLLLIITIILIPAIIVNIFIKDEEIKFEYKKNMTIRVKKNDGSIKIMPFELYLVGVLAGEMQITYPLEALKAQAVASRTYAMKKMAYNYKQEYDVVDDISHQVYLDFDYLKEVWKDKYYENINKIKTAVVETSGKYIEYKGKVIEAFFFSTSSGNTENSENVFGIPQPYLKSVSSTWDKYSPVYYSTKIFNDLEVLKNLNIKDSELKIENIIKNKTGSINKLKINSRYYSGTEFRTMLNLKSTNCDITQKNKITTIKCRGYGHGVGMSQYGALMMAKEGYDYIEILKHYYQGVEIKNL